MPYYVQGGLNHYAQRIGYRSHRPLNARSYRPTAVNTKQSKSNTYAATDVFGPQISGLTYMSFSLSRSLSLPVSLSLFLFLYLYLSLSLSLFLSVTFIFLFASASIYVSLSVCLSLCISLILSLTLYLYLSLSLSRHSYSDFLLHDKRRTDRRYR